MTTDATQVTQADREAAWPFRPVFFDDHKITRARWDAGAYDHLSPIQAFARHRITTTASLSAQVEALTAERDALRETSGAILSWWPEGSELTSRAAQAKGYGFAKDIQAARAALASTSEGEG